MLATSTTRRAALTSVMIVVAFGSLASRHAAAQGWPNRPITVVVPLGAGSASDLIARAVMDQLGRQLGQTIVVDNRPGAGGVIGANAVAKSAPDGYTMLVYGAMASAQALHAKLPYDTLADFIPVIPLGQQPLVVVTAKAKGYRTLADLVTAGKANAGALNYSTAGVGSASHFGAERLRASAGFEAQHIPFKGAAEAVTAVIAGNSDFSVQLPSTTLPFLKEGTLAVLAVSAPTRASVLPDVPTTVEAGLPPSSVYPFYTALYIPAHTPADIVERLHAETAKALQDPTVKARLRTLAVEPMALSRDEFTKFLHQDIDANVALVKAAKIPTQ